MNPERLQQIEKIYQSACSRSVEERDAFIALACGDDQELRREVESLLRSENSSTRFVTGAAFRMAGGSVEGRDTESFVGRQIGSFRVVSLLGAGGMGQVFRAKDTKLGREVAIKVLPASFARDADRLQRFGREARLLAALNHPHVASIYGLEEFDGTSALILELVEGPTLAERIAQGALKLSESLTIAQQIAQALESAHEKGIIHRDLKPANVKVTPDGTVKVLDFGLAKAFGGDASGPDLSQLPTITIERTSAGVIAGTPAYMSPEQARGKPLDRRADIWAFGCVLYEMLTGQPAFHGETISDTIAAVLEREPNWQAVPATTPPTVLRLMQRCLTKDASRRLRDIGDARIEIDEVLSSPTLPAKSTTPINAKPRRTAVFYALGAAVLSALFAAVAVWNLKTSPVTNPGPESRFTLTVPAGVELPAEAFGSAVAVSPDSRHVAFAGKRGTTVQLYLRSIQNAEAKVLAGTEGATQPFFSPDGRWLAFFAASKLKKLAIDGGVPVVICDAPASRGGFWGDNGSIVFSPQARGFGIFQVSADGGVAKQVTEIDKDNGETSHRLPELLPGGDTVLFTAYGSTYQDVSILAQSLKSGERHVLVAGASLPHYVSTGHLLFVQPRLPGTIMAVGFDPVTLKVNGTPIPVVEGVLTDRGDEANWGISNSGMLVYAPGGFQEQQSNLVFVDRKGGVTAAGTPPARPYNFPRISPDGRRVAASLQAIQNTLWTYDLITHAFNRLTFEGNNDWPVWTPDGEKVTYASNRAEPWRLFWKRFDGSEKEELLLPIEKGDQQPYSWSPDAKVLVYQDGSPTTGLDIWALSIADRKTTPIVQTAAAELDGSLSPDGRWLAYASNESGRFEVYVLSFTGSGGKWQISTEGGREPVWAHSGRELFYRSGTKVMLTEIAAESTFKAATPRLLFQGPYLNTPTSSAEYDVTPDDQRFLMVQPSEQQSPLTGLNVVLSWFEELKRRVPVQ
jgi:eukaryotic-like serine/threonine-protein kinase